MKKILSGKYYVRPGSVEDIPLIHELRVKQSLHYRGTPGFSLGLLTNEYQGPGFDPEKNLHLVLNQKNKLVAYIEFWDDEDPPVHPFFRFSVDPDFENQGLENYLLEWGEKNALQVLDRVDPELRIAMWSVSFHNVESSRKAMEAAGMKQIRHSFRMRIEMDDPPPEPIWPEGVILKPYDPEKDAFAVYQVDDEVFQDHFGYVKELEEEAYGKFLHYMTGSDAYDPTLWFLAMDEEEIAGICLCRKYGDEGQDTGHISVLGVRRPWRRKGIALALLQHALGEFYRRGKSKVDLGVDADSLTGATDLYLKAGMYVLRQNDLYEKELRPGKDVSVTSLESSEA